MKVYCLCKGGDFETPYTIAVFSSIDKAKDFVSKIITGDPGWYLYTEGWQTKNTDCGWFEINEFEVDK